MIVYGDNYNILDVNGYKFTVEFYNNGYIRCIPCTDQDREYVKLFLDSISHRAESVLYGVSNKVYSTEFDNCELYHKGIVSIKTTGLLDTKCKLYGLWPTCIIDYGMVEFTFDHTSLDYKEDVKIGDR